MCTYTYSFLDPPSTSLDLNSLTHICNLNCHLTLNFRTCDLLSKQQTFKNSDLGSSFTSRQLTAYSLDEFLLLFVTYCEGSHADGKLEWPKACQRPATQSLGPH